MRTLTPDAIGDTLATAQLTTLNQADGTYTMASAHIGDGLYLNKDERLKLTLNGPEGSTSNLLLWKPGTKHVNDIRNQHLRAAQAIGPGPTHGIG